MNAMIRFPVFLLRGLVMSVVIGIFVAGVFYLPGWVIGFGIDTFLVKNPIYRLDLFLGGITLGGAYLFLSQDFLRMYGGREVDEDSLKDLQHKMIYLALGLTAATYSILLALAPFEPRLHLFAGQARPDALTLAVFVGDNLCRGVLLDLFEIFDLGFGSLTHNRLNVPFGLYLVAFRFFTSGLLFAHIYLRFKEFRDPHGWQDGLGEANAKA